jgi:rhodanese-related sulfurtransferase
VFVCQYSMLYSEKNRQANIFWSLSYVPEKDRANLPIDKDREIICYCRISLRGHETSLLIKANGWKNVKVMEGGVMAWPFEREK